MVGAQQERARAAGLENVTASVELIQDYSGVVLMGHGRELWPRWIHP